MLSQWLPCHPNSATNGNTKLTAFSISYLIIAPLTGLLLLKIQTKQKWPGLLTTNSTWWRNKLRMSQLQLFLDKHNLWRCGGRLAKADILFCHPIIRQALVLRVQKYAQSIGLCMAGNFSGSFCFSVWLAGRTPLLGSTPHFPPLPDYHVKLFLPKWHWFCWFTSHWSARWIWQ